MPLVKISIVSVWDANQKKRISDEIHSALVECFKIPEDDYNHRIFEFDNSDFIRSKGRSERYTLIEMTVFPGRSRDAKRNLYQSIVKRLKGIGIDSKEVTIVLYEPPLENWGISGGLPADEVDIGFKLDV
jgi:phenylpyruvate tautomerase PptA (4-oxalocrotonate tautomerase family)